MALWVAFWSTSWENRAKPPLWRYWSAEGTLVVARHHATGGNPAAWASMTSFTQVRSVIRSALSSPWTVIHITRPDDWPVMPAERAGFMLKPAGFFDRSYSASVRGL